MTRTQRWTLVAAIIGSGVVFLDGTIVNLALRAIGRAPDDVPRGPRGPGLHRQRLPRGPRGAADPVRRPRRLLRPAADLRDRPDRLRPQLAALRHRPDPRVARPVPARPGRGRRAARAGLAVDHHGDVRGPGPGAGVRDVGRGDVGADALGQPIGGLLVDLLSWRVAFLINVPLVAIALWATIRHMQESRDETATGSLRLARRGVGAVAIGGLAFGAIARPADELAGQRSRGSR